MAIPDHAQLVFTGKTFDVYQWEQEMFDGSTKTFEKLRRNHSIDIVAVDQDKKIYILEEEQPGRPPFLGIVGGTCEPGEDPIETAKRELLEETGLISDDWELFGSYSFSSRIDYKSHVFIARGCQKVQDQKLDTGGEKITVQTVEWNHFLQLLASPKFRAYEVSIEALRACFLGKEEELKQRILYGTT